MMKDFVSRITIESMIEYELINHDCFYTRESLSIVNLIKSIYHSKNKEMEA